MSARSIYGGEGGRGAGSLGTTAKDTANTADAASTSASNQCSNRCTTTRRSACPYLGSVVRVVRTGEGDPVANVAGFVPQRNARQSTDLGCTEETRGKR